MDNSKKIFDVKLFYEYNDKEKFEASNETEFKNSKEESLKKKKF